MRRGLDSFLWKLLDGPGEDVTEVLVWTGGLLAAIVVLIWAVVRIRARFRDDDDPAAADHSMLLGLGDLHRQGDVSEAEYRSIKGQLIRRLEESSSSQSSDQT